MDVIGVLMELILYLVQLNVLNVQKGHFQDKVLPHAKFVKKEKLLTKIKMAVIVAPLELILLLVQLNALNVQKEHSLDGVHQLALCVNKEK